MCDSRGDPKLYCRPDRPFPQLLTIQSAMLAPIKRERDHLTLLFSSHSLKASREIISLPFYFSTMKKKTLTWSVVQWVDSSYFQIHLTQVPISLWRSLSKCPSRKPHSIQSTHLYLTKQEISYNKEQLSKYEWTWTVQVIHYCCPASLPLSFILDFRHGLGRILVGLWLISW